MRLRFLLGVLCLAVVAVPAPAYVEAPMSLGSVIQQSVVICSMVVTKVDKQNNLIIFQKVADIKGKHPQDVIKHNIGRGGLRAGEWEEIMRWAEVGKPAIFFHNGSASETYIGQTWYQAYPNGEWWGMSHGEPFLMRSYSGKVDKLPGFVAEIVAGKEVIVPCMVDGDKETLHKKTAKVQRVKASLKIQDYNPKRDFVGWGGEDIRRLAGMPGFDRFAALGNAGADAQSATAIDFDADGRVDLCLVSANKVSLLLNGGDGFSEVMLPGLTGGARSAVWADYTGDGLPDLLLATPTGPRLYTNLGKGQFRDDTKLLPVEAAYNLTAAAWGDFDGDGKPDIVLANGFHGLRMYRNIRPDDATKKISPPKLGGWLAVGPFRHKDGPQKNFETEFGPEKDLDPARKHKGKRDVEVAWTKQEYPDGQANDLAPFGANCATYLQREIEVAAETELPISLGSDDNLTVWLNGQKIHSDPTKHACAPDQVVLPLKLKPGKNTLLLKVCNTDGAYAFYFKVGAAGAGSKPWFEDASVAWGLGENGLAGALKGDSLSVADFDGDGKPDVLYGAGTGVVLRNTGKKFEIKTDAGISYKPGKVGPALCDFDGDGHVDLFIPQSGGASKLYRNDGTGKFVDVTAKAGDLAKLAGQAVGAAWGDFDNDGKPDLLVCVLRGPNRYFKNNGDGTFTDKSADVGISQRVFNTQAATWADLNNDGRLDLIMANEGQDSAALFGTPADASKWAQVVVSLPAGSGLVGGKVTVTGADGKRVASAEVYGGDGRGSQGGLAPRFVLPPAATSSPSAGPTGRPRRRSSPSAPTRCG
ncbi:FG-GAP repeat domain-containing protein [Fimbriiglobus ruber]|uniref:ASPIC/UnbV domain protein n=1 Tax=Fimbriiglobus ruber TaxID=1908690 RepID=A0A225DDZ1_9BACT|nr:VCBS repeat-containing protein [Fimbriiglobus ruber]OWK36738.1 ASPIC/UnbV domain protein [Fimbriiglobus ruber]